MGGMVESIGKAFNSTPGRVLTGIATGGMSEIGREAALVARKNIANPTIAAGLGAAAGGASNLGASSGAALSAANNASKVAPVVPLAAASAVPVVGSAAGSLTKSNSDEQAAAQAQLDQASRTVETQQQAAARDLAARTETPQEALEARRRAQASALGRPQGQRRASAYLSGSSV